MGWNLAIGGSGPPMLGRKHSEATREKLKAASNSRSDEVKAYCKSKLRSKGKRSEKGSSNIRIAKQATGAWRLPWANKEVWLQADRIYDAMQANPSYGEYKIKRLTGIVDGNIINVYKKIKNTYWNPSKDMEWVQWKVNYIKE